MNRDGLSSATRGYRDLASQTSDQFADLIYQYWVASEQRDRVMTGDFVINHDNDFWQIMNHMQDLFVRVPYSSKFFLSVQKREFSKKIDTIVRESSEWQERLSYRKFFKQLNDSPVKKHRKLINDFMTNQLKVARRYSHLAYKEHKYMSYDIGGRDKSTREYQKAKQKLAKQNWKEDKIFHQRVLKKA